MKNINLPILLIITATVLVTPLYALPNDSKNVKTTAVLSESVVSTNKVTDKQDTICLYDKSSNSTNEIKMSDYLFGVVAGECPMLYHDEAIKAQIVAAHTYAVFRSNENADNDYDITTDPETSQTYITKETAKANWGAAADKYEEKLTKLIKEVENELVLYNGKPILAAYHAISAGKTEKSANVWGSDYAYLQSVESIADKLCNGYLTEVTIASSDADKKLKSLNITAERLKNAKFEKTECGNVTKITVDKNEISVSKITEIFGLRSQNFDIAFKNGKLCFTVRGYGHQVGMSQNGANYMANAGATYKEILCHYYKNVEIKEYT